MARGGRDIKSFNGDEDGQATLEWALVMACFILPTVAVLNLLLNVLVVHYRMVTFVESLPFP